MRVRTVATDGHIRGCCNEVGCCSCVCNTRYLNMAALETDSQKPSRPSTAAPGAADALVVAYETLTTLEELLREVETLLVAVPLPPDPTDPLDVSIERLAYDVSAARHRVAIAVLEAKLGVRRAGRL